MMPETRCRNDVTPVMGSSMVPGSRFTGRWLFFTAFFIPRAPNNQGKVVRGVHWLCVGTTQGVRPPMKASPKARGGRYEYRQLGY